VIQALEVFTDLDMTEVGRRLALARQQRGLSQVAAAVLADIDLGNLNEIERGKRTGMRVQTLWRLCQVLGVSPNTIVGWRLEMEPCPIGVTMGADINLDMLLGALTR
jgi:transcriptional regulator with XRE-family HTH domain